MNTIEVSPTPSVSESFDREQTAPVPDVEYATGTENSKIMIVDDEPVVVKVLRKHLADVGYKHLVSVTDSTKAVATVQDEQPDLLLLDIMMPDVDGLNILTSLRTDPRFARLPIVVLSAATERSLKMEALRQGAYDFLGKPVDVEEMLPRVRNALVVKNYQDHLEKKVYERTRELEESRRDVIHCLARAAEYRDDDTGRHVIRVGNYAGVIARELGMDEARARMLEQAATLHDVGKIGVPDSILHKPGKLSPDEFTFMQKHSGYGKGICDRMTSDEYHAYATHTTFGAEIMADCSWPLLDMASTIALTHHEKWDGSGYPLGLAGEDIPIEGRITAVADVFDALGNVRPYKPAFPVEKCFAILEEGRGQHFDPRVLDAFFARKADILAVQIKYAEIE